MKKYFKLFIKWVMLTLTIALFYCIFDKNVDMFNWFMGGMFTLIWIRLTEGISEQHLYKEYWNALRQTIVDIEKTIKAVEIDPDNDVHIGMKGTLTYVLEMMDKMVKEKK